MSSKIYLSPNGKRGKKSLVEVVRELQTLPVEEAYQNIVPMFQNLKKDDLITVLRALGVKNVSTMSPSVLLNAWDHVIQTMGVEEIFNRLEIAPKRTKRISLPQTVRPLLFQEARTALEHDFVVQKILVDSQGNNVILFLYNHEDERLSMVTLDIETEALSKTFSDHTKKEVTQIIKSLGQEGYKLASALQRSIVSEL